MAEPFLSEIRIMSFGYNPREWLPCDGRLMAINQNQALFSLLGTTYGGDGVTNFALPDLRGRVPLHRGSGHDLGVQAGAQAHTLSLAEMPTHTHVLQASPTAASQAVPTGNVLAGSAPKPIYGPPANLTPLHPTTVPNVGGSQAHLNMQPFLALNFCIAVIGIFPSPN